MHVKYGLDALKLGRRRQRRAFVFKCLTTAVGRGTVSTLQIAVTAQICIGSLQCAMIKCFLPGHKIFELSIVVTHGIS